MATPSAHLTAEVERRHGAPDRRLRLGSSTFPVHSAVLAAASPVFASLFESFSDEEISLPAAGDAAASPAPPPAACDGRRVSLFLCLLYNHGSASIGSVDDALGVIELGAYWDCPSVLPAADAYLADDVLGSTSVLSYRQDRTYLYSSLAAGHVHRASVDGTQLFHYLSLAAKHKLRRLAAACLPLTWAMDAPFPEALLKNLDGATLSPMLAALHQQTRSSARCSNTYSAECAGRSRDIFLPSSSPCCDNCKQAHHLDWHELSNRLVRAMAASGWGYS